MTISEAALDVLRRGHLDGDWVFKLPPGQLDRVLYVEVNELLSRLGGKWNRRQAGHVFTDLPPGPLLELVLDSGDMPPKNPTAYFPTPRIVAKQLLMDGALLSLRPPVDRVLEPSAGTGHLADAMLDCSGVISRASQIECCEVVPRYREVLTGKGYTVVAEDFLTYEPGPVYDAVVMNPPFAVDGDRQAWVTHIEHALTVLAPGGLLLAVVPGSFPSRGDKRIAALRELVENYGYWLPVEGQAFVESGTGVSTVLISVEPPERVPDREPQMTLWEGQA